MGLQGQKNTHTHISLYSKFSFIAVFGLVFLDYRLGSSWHCESCAKVNVKSGLDAGQYMGQCSPHLFPLFSHFIYWTGEAFSQKLRNKLTAIWLDFVQMKWGRGQRAGLGSVLKSIKIICLKFPFTNLLSFSAEDRLYWCVADSKCLNQSVFTAQCKWGVGKLFGDMAASADGEYRRKKKQQERERSPTFRENQWEDDWDFTTCTQRCVSLLRPSVCDWGDGIWWRLKWRLDLRQPREFDGGKTQRGGGNVRMSFFSVFPDQNYFGQMEASAEQEEMTQKIYVCALKILELPEEALLQLTVTHFQLLQSAASCFSSDMHNIFAERSWGGTDL